MRPLLPGLLGLALGGCHTAGHGGIVVLSLDTLRADRLGAWGNPRGLTPNLDRFAAESVIFDQAYAQANETLFSHSSLFTSRYASELAPLDGAFRIPRGVPTLAEVLGAYGYDTAAVVAGGHLARAYGLDRGFTVYDDASSWGSLRETAPKALRWLDTRADDAPFFLFVHGYDTHDRYLKPTPFGYAFADPGYEGAGAAVARTPGGTMVIADGRVPAGPEPLMMLTQSRPRFENGAGITQLAPDAAVLDDADVQHLTDVYDGAVAYADAAFGTFIAGLDARGLLDEVTIVVLSDHGEALGEEGVFHHRLVLNDQTLHVPLIVRPPGGTTGRRVSALVELTDVMPTLLEVAGAQPPVDIRGHSLLAAVRGGAAPGRTTAFSEGALRLLSVRGTRTRLSIEGLSPGNPYGAALLAAFPLDGVSFRVSGDPTAAPALRSALVAWREGMPRVDAAARVPSATTAEMRKHGYWDVTP